ncbi:unnamed protein product, partial [Hydatigera taeniaeformis]|uniref:Guanylate cyclase domain-containing protein n=1 Tax=Hydatigena taeniaeformis TaxID=6205 RepID=A0A0R3WX25_HYDTA
MRVNVLQKGFNIHSQPKNYMNFRTNVEEIIYHAVRSDTAKSPYTSFKIANKYISAINDFDVLAGMRVSEAFGGVVMSLLQSLKALVKMVFDSSVRASTVIHRVGDLFLMDEFDIDSFILTSSSYGHWPWLKAFMRRHEIYLNGAEFTRHALTMRELYIKFLYHTVGPKNSLVGEMTQRMLKSGVDGDGGRGVGVGGDSGESAPSLCNAIVSSSPPELAACSGASSASADGQESQFHRSADDFLRLAKWKVDDLSFLVGSDLAIFGTKCHPCISLRLSPLHKPINVLTGIDIWLENILNEVPEVAMCFHNEGIVMQE